MKYDNETYILWWTHECTIHRRIQQSLYFEIVIRINIRSGCKRVEVCERSRWIAVYHSPPHTHKLELGKLSKEVLKKDTLTASTFFNPTWLDRRAVPRPYFTAVESFIISFPRIFYSCVGVVNTATSCNLWQICVVASRMKWVEMVEGVFSSSQRKNLVLWDRVKRVSFLINNWDFFNWNEGIGTHGGRPT